MLRPAKQYLKEEMNIELPAIANEAWFAIHNLPMFVRCTCCNMIMALPAAKIEDDGTIYCSTCFE